jgi:hypothetical protein
VRNPRRSLFYGVELDAFLRRDDAVAETCFHDHQGRHVAMIPGLLPQEPATVGAPLAPVPALC